ncbi:MAG: DUF58 domain-containing protein [Conexivisphaerales archaeon]
MKLTVRGRIIVYIIILAISMSALFKDILLASVALLLFMLLIADYAYLKMTKELSLDQQASSIKMLRGEEKEVRVKIDDNNNSFHTLNADNNWLSFVQNSDELILKVKPKRAGYYKLDSLRFERQSRLKLLAKIEDKSFKLQAEVYPRYIASLAEAIEYMVSSAREGEVASILKGRGLEYASTREYIAGDELNAVDWKATARHGKLMIKEFLADKGPSTHLICDVAAAGEVTKDELLTALISISLAFARSGNKLSVTIHNSGVEIMHTSSNVLSSIISYVIRNEVRRPEYIYQILDILPRARRYITKLAPEFWLKILTSGEMERKDKENGRIIEQNLEEYGYAIILSSCSGNYSVIADMVDVLIARMPVALGYSAPWMDVDDLEEAYRLHESLKKLLSMLRDRGVSTFRMSAGISGLELSSATYR